MTNEFMAFFKAMQARLDRYNKPIKATDFFWGELVGEVKCLTKLGPKAIELLKRIMVVNAGICYGLVLSDNSNLIGIKLLTGNEPCPLLVGDTEPITLENASLISEVVTEFRQNIRQVFGQEFLMN
jgi:hypothetical protein